ncbi:helix-turn-helix domain-containing protein [Solimicrobium silvestre]|uniref:Uncharacterized protein n=1 Tax=Solimicrobium silvestre TaxID=2099400 RepID=A0A2S9GTH9_9BURK|nr:helix-turn-helix domain-containing protein [Solimicrobium silvestre]PRC91029.1 hypothetical protein S2091_4217 [Solimicrobium silvestre]
MRFPNLRYGNNFELQYYCQGKSIKVIAKRLRRTERTISDWLNCKKKMPWWVCEVLRLQDKEHEEMMRQMFWATHKTRAKLGVVSTDAKIIPFIKKEKKELTEEEKLFTLNREPLSAPAPGGQAAASHIPKAKVL